MTEDRLAQIIRATADQLLAAFNKTAAIKHEGSKGTAREDPVLNFVQGRLPRTVVAVGSSEVIDATGMVSAQQDIVIVDPSTPPFLDEGHQRIYPAECVHGVIEVKGTLNKAEVVDACNKIASVKRLPKMHYHPDPFHRTYPDPTGRELLNHRPTFGWVFAYRATTRIETLSDNVIRWCETHPPAEWPDGLFVVGKGVIAWFLDGVPHEVIVPHSVLGFVDTSHARDVLLMMALSLHMAYVTAWMPPLRLHAYVPNAVLGVPRWSDPPAPRWPSPGS